MYFVHFLIKFSTVCMIPSVQVQCRCRHGPPTGAPAPLKCTHPQHSGGVSSLHQRCLPSPPLFPAAAPGRRSAWFQLHRACLPRGSDPWPGLLPAGCCPATWMWGGLYLPAAGPRGQSRPCALGRVRAWGSESEEGGPGGAQSLPGGKEWVQMDWYIMNINVAVLLYYVDLLWPNEQVKLSFFE